MLKIPDKLATLLNGSEYQASIQAFADSVGKILADNKLPFFPGYTDHGTDHVERVLQTIAKLIPGRASCAES